MVDSEKYPVYMVFTDGAIMKFYVKVSGNTEQERAIDAIGQIKHMEKCGMDKAKTVVGFDALARF
jgi:hypothetical protein